MRRIQPEIEGALLLSSSQVGSISKCRCCNYYHLTLGNVTLRLAHRDLLDLAEMLIDALERCAVSDLKGAH